MNTHIEDTNRDAERIVVPQRESKHDGLAAFGFAPAPNGEYHLPERTIAFEAHGQEDRNSLTRSLIAMGVENTSGLSANDRQVDLYRLEDPSLIPLIRKAIPASVKLWVAGDTVNMDGFELAKQPAPHVSGINKLTAASVKKLTASLVEPEVIRNPLLAYSLRGQADTYSRLAVAATPLLGDVCLKGQVTIWYAGPNTGKTLLALSLAIDAVREDRIAPGNIFYINADDNGSGFSTKLRIMDDLGAHTLSPGFRNLKPADLIAKLREMAEDDAARGVLIIIDTVKKFGNLMDKKESSAMAQAFRQVAMKGGSVLGLAHTTKNANTDGTPRYAGTSDLVDDADAVYTISSLSTATQAKEKVVEFRCIKARGDSAERAAYAYAGEAGVDYADLLTSVRPVDPDQVDDFKRVEEQRSDAELVAVVADCIADGFNTKMVLAKEVASRAGVSAREAARMLDRYAGNDPTRHRWRYAMGERGAHVFELLPPMLDSASPGA